MFCFDLQQVISCRCTHARSSSKPSVQSVRPRMQKQHTPLPEGRHEVQHPAPEQHAVNGTAAHQCTLQGLNVGMERCCWAQYHCDDGLPCAFVTDRGTQFTSGFFKELCRLWKIQQCFSTAYHPRSNGQTEHMNRIVEDMIRHYVSPTHDDWDEHLTQIEFAINNAHHEGLKNTPFYINYRRNP